MKRTFLKSLGLVMALGSLAGNAGATLAPSTNQTTQREAISQRPQAPRPVSVRNDFGGGITRTNITAKARGTKSSTGPSCGAIPIFPHTKNASNGKGAYSGNRQER